MTLIGARVVLRLCPRCLALSNILFRSGLFVFCGTGGLVGNLLNVGRLLVGVADGLLAGAVGGNNGVCIAGCRRDTNCPFGQVCVDVSSPGGTRVEKVIIFSKLNNPFHCFRVNPFVK